MTNEERIFLSLPRYPAYFDLQETCWVLGLKLHEGRILVREKVLDLSGKRQKRKSWKFASAYILELVDDLDWLAQARNTLTLHWEKCNAPKRKKIAKCKTVDL